MYLMICSSPAGPTKSSIRPGAKSAISTAQPKSVAILAGEDSEPSALGGAGSVAQSMQVPTGITDPSGVLPYSRSVPEAEMDYATKRELKDLADYVEELREVQDHLSDTFYGAMNVLNVKVGQYTCLCCYHINNPRLANQISSLF